MEENNNMNMDEKPAMDGAPAGGDMNKDVEENKAISVLSYIGILVLIPLLAKKDSDFAQFHAKQGLVVFIGEIIISVVAIIPFLGWIVWFVGWIFFVIISIMGIMNALGGKKKELPLVGSMAKKMMK